MAKFLLRHFYLWSSLLVDTVSYYRRELTSSKSGHNQTDKNHKNINLTDSLFPSDLYVLKKIVMAPLMTQSKVMP